ncbi:uncharacterized protein LOC131574731 isoform X1 [Poecile atricapillus]|uniref:uncharacterized protein LOC131574731 isoform X1 n=1 Tax=Poecile atricapillus TaxID=48891 RepID=UPI002738EC55|nr:uncharacterized protein LOC131574731 isoform X1 [Poecile atricapillus]
MGTNIRLSWMFANILRKPILDVMGIKKKKKRWKIQVILSGSYSKENNTRPDMGRNSQEGQKPYETILPQEVNWARAHNNISVSQNPGSWNYTGVPLCWQIGQAPPWLLLTAPGHSNSPSQGSDCARLSQQVMEDGSTTQRVSHLSYSSEGVTLVKTWRGSNLKTVPSFLLKPAVPALILLLCGETHICQLSFECGWYYRIECFL